MRIEEVIDTVPEMERLKKSIPSGYMPSAPLAFHTIPVTETTSEVSGVSGISPRKVMGHSPYDSIKPVDSDQHRASEIAGVQTRSLVATPAPIEHNASGSVLLQKIGTITARLPVSMESLLQSLHLVPEWLIPSTCLIGRCNTLKTDRQESVDNTAAEKAKKGHKKEKMQPKSMLYFVSIVAQVAHTLFSTLFQYMYQGFVFTRDEGIPLLGRVTKSCIETCGEVCEQVRKACSDSSEDKTDNPLSWCVDRYKEMVSWMKAWIFG